MEKEPLTRLKIIMLGDASVGKTSLLTTFVDEKFNPTSEATIGMDSRFKVMSVEGNFVHLTLWDTAGQETFRAVTPNYYRNAQGAILVYDVTNPTSFKRLENWFDDLNLWLEKPDIIKMVIGNKVDLPNKAVTRQEGMQMARKFGALFVEASAKENTGVLCAFEELVLKILETPGLWEALRVNDVINLANDANESSEQSTCSAWGRSCSL